MRQCRALLALGVVMAALSVVVPSAARAQDITCERGDLEVVRVDFVGNRTFPDDQLALGIVTTPSSWARRVLRVIGTRRCLDPVEVQKDRLRLLVFYSQHGFSGVRVVTDVDTVRKRAVAVRFGIDEGAPVMLEQFTITGLDSVQRADRITAGLPVKVGGRFDKYAMEDARDTILRRLHDNGYPSADILRSYESDTAKRVASLKFDVATGPKAWIGTVNVAITPLEGKAVRIADGEVRRTIGVDPGDLYRERDLEVAKRTLYLSDAYRHVEVVPDTASLAPEGDSTINVNIALAETYMRSVRPSVGWATLDCFRTQVDYTDVAFLGGLRRLDLSARASKIGLGYPTAMSGPAAQVCSPSARQDIYSDTLNYYVGATLRQSSLFGFRALPTITLYSELRSEYKVYQRNTPVGVILSLNQSLRRQAAATYAYQLEYGRTTAEPAFFCGVFGICDANEQDFLRRMQRLATASVTLAHDRRNDPFYPTGGSAASLELREASRFIGSDPDLQFSKGLVDASWYFGLPANAVLAVRARAGAVVGQRLVGGGGSTSFIPQQERLYAGGANTVRGFGQNELGPVVYLANSLRVCAAPTGECVTPETAQDTVYFTSTPERKPQTLPVGGNTMVVANVELRMPSPFIPDRLQVAFFADAGQVWTRGATGAERSFGNLRVTPGFGIRVASPVGPVRLDIGYSQYDRAPGAAYYDAAPQNNQALLYCVSPGNALPVTGWRPDWRPDRESSEDPPLQANSSRGCPASYQPVRRTSLFRRLRFQASIGQAF